LERLTVVRAELMQRKLHIDENQLTQLFMSLLVLAMGDSTSAVEYITQRRQRKKREERMKKRKGNERGSRENWERLWQGNG